MYTKNLIAILDIDYYYFIIAFEVLHNLYAAKKQNNLCIMYRAYVVSLIFLVTNYCIMLE